MEVVRVNTILFCFIFIKTIQAGPFFQLVVEEGYPASLFAKIKRVERFLKKQIPLDQGGDWAELKQCAPRVLKKEWEEFSRWAKVHRKGQSPARPYPPVCLTHFDFESHIQLLLDTAKRDWKNSDFEIAQKRLDLLYFDAAPLTTPTKWLWDEGMWDWEGWNLLHEDYLGRLKRQAHCKAPLEMPDLEPQLINGLESSRDGEKWFKQGIHLWKFIDPLQQRTLRRWSQCSPKGQHFFLFSPSLQQESFSPSRYLWLDVDKENKTVVRMMRLDGPDTILFELENLETQKPEQGRLSKVDLQPLTLELDPGKPVNEIPFFVDGKNQKNFLEDQPQPSRWYTKWMATVGGAALVGALIYWASVKKEPVSGFQGTH